MNSPTARAVQGSITDVAGIDVGHCTDARRPTGCTVVLVRKGAVGGVDVRGAAPGTRETDLLAPGNLVQQVHAVLLTGGSAWGLDAAGGVMRWLEEHGIGLDVGLPVGGGLVPIVPAAVLFDLHLGNGRVRPDAAAGYAACAAARSEAPLQGSFGAGAGAVVGKLFGLGCAMKGGIGTASVSAGGYTVGAIVAVNALGDVRDPNSGQVVAGARTPAGDALRDSRRALLRGDAIRPVLAGTNTTIGVVATDATLTKAQAQRLAQSAHDGLARTIYPVHTMSDGDTVFALATGHAGTVDAAPMTLLGTLAAEATARAVLQAVLAAGTLQCGVLRLPGAADWRPR